MVGTNHPCNLTTNFCCLSFQGDYIWIEPVSGHEFDVAIGARVICAEGRRIQVKDDDGKVGQELSPFPTLQKFSVLWCQHADLLINLQEQWLTPERRIKAMHATSVQGVEDMISLGDLHEAGILRNLLIRYNENLIYVSVLQLQLWKSNTDQTFNN